jgi:hypothetical protein
MMKKHEKTRDLSNPVEIWAGGSPEKLVLEQFLFLLESQERIDPRGPCQLNTRTGKESQTLRPFEKPRRIDWIRVKARS